MSPSLVLASLQPLPVWMPTPKLHNTLNHDHHRYAMTGGFLAELHMQEPYAARTRKGWRNVSEQEDFLCYQAAVVPGKRIVAPKPLPSFRAPETLSLPAHKMARFQRYLNGFSVTIMINYPESSKEQMQKLVALSG